MKYFLPIILFLAACAQNETSPSPGDSQEIFEDTTAIVFEPTKVVPDTASAVIDSAVVENLAVASNEYEDVDWLAYEQSMTKDYSFVIVLSTKSYESALRRAKDASKKLGYPLDLRDLHPNPETGLALPKEVCEGICGGGVVDYPCYLPRNDWGSTKYVSIEYSDGYEGFTKGYYIVLIASGERGDPEVKAAVNEARKYYKDAYAKTCGVYMGCGC